MTIHTTRFNVALDREAARAAISVCGWAVHRAAAADR